MVIINADAGIAGGKYQQNLTAGCATPFTTGTGVLSGGTDAGLNN